MLRSSSQVVRGFLRRGYRCVVKSDIGSRVKNTTTFLRPFSSVSSGDLSGNCSTYSNIEPVMFCRQCEQTQNGVACTTQGICGKDADTSAMQDAAIHMVKAISIWCVSARKAGVSPDKLHDANIWTLRTTFSTLTNVNFSEKSVAAFISEGLDILNSLKLIVPPDAAPKEEVANPPISTGDDLDMYEAFGRSVGVLKRKDRMGDDDAFSLNEIGLYGLKGVCAYACHASELLDNTIPEDIIAPIHEIWNKLASDEPDMEGLLANALRVGEVNAATLALLDESHAKSLGVPEPTEVKETAVKGKAILVSGHDMKDLQVLLEQTEGTGVNVYTHGELLPAHSYPELRKYKHLVGNYGTAWQAQKFEFASFPGPIVVTTNCLMPPRRNYIDRVFTTNVVAFDNVKHINNRDFSSVIDKAKEMEGFKKTVEPARHVTVGFNHRSVLPLAGEVIRAINSGNLSHIFLIGGCDGAEWSRNYYTDLANFTPDDSLILTLGCAKNRFIRSENLRTAKLANGIPRVLDMGQCNDSYSAIVVATELARALNCSVNDLPLSLALSHLEQKAAAVLLTLLHLGVKNIRLGPKMPAFITPNILDFLEKEYNLMPIGENPVDDLKLMMSRA